MNVVVIDADSNGTTVVPYTCPADKIAKVEILNVSSEPYSNQNSPKPFHLYLVPSYKKITVGGVEVLRPQALTELPATVPAECIRAEGVDTSSGSTATHGADIPRIHYLNAGESFQIKGQSSITNRGLVVRIRVMEEAV